MYVPAHCKIEAPPLYDTFTEHLEIIILQKSIPFKFIPCTMVYDRHLQSYRPFKMVARAVAKEKFTKIIIMSLTYLTPTL